MSKEAQNPGKLSILLVDDSEFSLNYLEKHFRERGFSVFCTTRDKEAFTLAKRRSPSIIATDVQVHKENKYSFFKALFKDPETRIIPLILFGAETKVTLQLKEQSPAECRHLSKPIRFEDLFPFVSELLKRVLPEGGGRERRISLFADLQDFSLLDVYQLVTNSRQSMRLKIKGPHGDGRLYFDRGRLVDAALQDLRGVEAAYEILAWTKGKITGELYSWMRGDNIQQSNEAMLLEALRRADTPLFEDDESSSINIPLEPIAAFDHQFGGIGGTRKEPLARRDEAPPLGQSASLSFAPEEFESMVADSAGRLADETDVTGRADDFAQTGMRPEPVVSEDSSVHLNRLLEEAIQSERVSGPVRSSKDDH